MAVKMTCDEVWREVSSYIDGDLDASLRRQVEEHIKTCKHCSAVLDGTANVVRLVGTEQSFDLPVGFSKRLYTRFEHYLKGKDTEAPSRGMDLGITADKVPLGSHLLYFWESEQDFERGVSFLYPGLGKKEHCIVFGHDEALEHVLKVVRSNGYDPDQLLQERQVTLLRRHTSAQPTLSDFRDVMEAAMRAGATGIRWLGNLGMGRDPLPAGDSDVVELENKATELISQFPGVIVCMYDVRTLPGGLILKGGLQQHQLTVCCDGVHDNPFYVPEQPPSHFRHVQ